MSVRAACLWLVATVVVAQPIATAQGPSIGSAERDFELVPYGRCLAGGWGTPGPSEWRIALGIFDHHGESTEHQLETHHLGYGRYIAMWLAGGPNEREPLALVSTPFPDEASARRALSRYRRIVPDAYVRQYRVLR